MSNANAKNVNAKNVNAKNANANNANARLHHSWATKYVNFAKTLIDSNYTNQFKDIEINAAFGIWQLIAQKEIKTTKWLRSYAESLLDFSDIPMMFPSIDPYITVGDFVTAMLQVNAMGDEQNKNVTIINANAPKLQRYDRLALDLKKTFEKGKVSMKWMS